MVKVRRRPPSGQKIKCVISFYYGRQHIQFTQYLAGQPMVGYNLDITEELKKLGFKHDDLLEIISVTLCRYHFYVMLENIILEK